MLKQDSLMVQELAQAIMDLKEKTQYCQNCFSVSDSHICSICSSPRRDKSVICVVEDIKDVMAIENTAQYQGVYFVLGGVISPLNGVGPNDLKIDLLVDKVKNSAINEVIMALSPTIDGDTTTYYIAKKIKDTNVKLSTIARGIPIGNNLEYTDEVTLGRSIVQRIDYHTQ